MGMTLERTIWCKNTFELGLSYDVLKFSVSILPKMLVNVPPRCYNDCTYFEIDLFWYLAEIYGVKFTRFNATESFDASIAINVVQEGYRLSKCDVYSSSRS